MSYRFAAITCLSVSLMGCATPAVVTPSQTSDVVMNCHQLAAAIDDARRFEDQAREDRGVTALNIAAAVFFWPALVGTYYNTEEAIEAAQARQVHLRTLYDQQGCAQERASNR